MFTILICENTSLKYLCVISRKKRTAIFQSQYQFAKILFLKYLCVISGKK